MADSEILLNIPTAPGIDGAQHLHSGKVRDLYELPGGELLMVASDRISIFDFVLDTTIPDKGEILTRMSLWWFEQLADLAPNHVISTDVPDAVRGRAVVCERLAMYPVECVARGYLTGSGLIDYRATGRGLRRRAARRARGRQPAAGADLHAGHQGRARRPRRERLVRRRRASPSAPTAPPSCAT